MVKEFHPSCHGRNVTVKCYGSTAVRNSETFDKALLFSKTPCQENEKVSLFFKKTTNRWTGTPRIGFTNQNPEVIDPELLPTIFTPEAMSRMWIQPLKQTDEENIFVEYQFGALGLITKKQVGQQEALLDTCGAVDFKEPVWVTVDLSGGYDIVIIKTIQDIVPQFILDEEGSYQQQYLMTLMKGSRRVGKFTSLCLIGPPGAGKTSLMKKLIGQRFDPLESSTQGVDISMACQIDGTGSWSGHKQDSDFKKHEILAAFNRSFPDETSTIFFGLSDFGGDLFSPTTRMLVPFAFCIILVFNLDHDLDKPAVIQTDGPCRKGTGPHNELTTWECMDHYLHDAFVYHLICPLIIIVGTHRKNAAERTHSQFAKLKEALSKTPFKDRIWKPFFAVENSLEDSTDSEVLALRRLIENMGRWWLQDEIPVKWVKFALARCNYPPFWTFSTDLLQGYTTGIMEQETEMMLKYVRALGQVYFHPHSQHDNKNLIGVDWLLVVDAIGRVAACLEPKEQVSSLSKSWQRLTEEGILEDHLLDYLWKDLLVKRQQSIDEFCMKKHLLDIMCAWDFLFERRPVEKKGKNVQTPGGLQHNAEEMTYFVPCAIRKHQVTKHMHVPPDQASSHVFYIYFDNFIHDLMFHFLVVRTSKWSQKQQGVDLEPRLGYRQATFSVDNDHDVELELSPKKMAYIKVCVKRLATVSFGGSSKGIQVQPAPSPSVMCKVRDLLHALLKGAYWTKHSRFTFGVQCPCDPEGALHFLPLSDCLKKEAMRCPQTPSLKIDTRGVREMFCRPEDLPSRQLDPYVMSEKHLVTIASKLGQEWEQLGANLNFTKSDIFKFKQEGSSINSSIFNMLVAWSQREGGDSRSKAKMLSQALDSCGRRDVVDDLLIPCLY